MVFSLFFSFEVKKKGKIIEINKRKSSYGAGFASSRNISTGSSLSGPIYTLSPCLKDDARIPSLVFGFIVKYYLFWSRKLKKEVIKGEKDHSNEITPLIPEKA
jgi:hypothetical protein